MTADSRTLDYCGVRSIAGREIADELFGRRLPAGLDMDHQGDQEAVAAIVREASRCDGCPERHWCEG